MELKCDSCAAPVGAGDIDDARAIARCSFCGAVMDLSRRPGGPGGGDFREVERAEVPLPARIAVSKEAGGLCIRRRWFSWKVVPLLGFAAIWFGFLVFWYGMAFGANAPPAFLLFPLIHVGVGVFLAYTALAGLLNTTTLRVGGGEIRVSHGPLWWPGGGTWRTGAFDQLYCVQRTRRSKQGVHFVYDLAAREKGGGKVTLVRGLEEEDQALFLEQRVEKHLGIRDRPVGGELPR